MHWLQRCARGWRLLLLRRRVTQLAALVEQTEQGIDRARDELAHLQMALTCQRYRLRFATEQGAPACQSVTWGL